MLTFEQILLQTIQILTLISGILGVSVSFFLLFSPNLILSVSNVLNRQVSIDEKIETVDKEVNIDSFFYSNNIIIGACLAAGSVFSLIFLFFKWDTYHFAHIFSATPKDISMNSLILHFMSWVAKIACFLGLIFGVILLFYPEKMRRIEGKLNLRIKTRPIVDMLNNTVFEFDSLFFRHPIIFGIIGFFLSVSIVILSTLNLLG